MSDQPTTDNLMNFIEYDIPQHVGLDRNKATGADPDGALVPDEIFNLVPDRRGSLMPFGNPKAHGVSAPGTLIGFDTRGLSSFQTAANKFSIFDGDSSTFSAATYTGFDNTVHLPGAGAYHSHDKFFARTNEDVSPYHFEPFTIDPVVSPHSSDDSEASGSKLAKDPIAGLNPDADVLGMAYYDYGGSTGERWAMVTREGFIKTGTGFDVTGDHIYNLGVPVRAIAVSPTGTMIAVSDPGDIWRSTDGINWSAMSNPSNRILRDVTYDVQNATWVAVGADIRISTNNGTSWVVAESVAGEMSAYGVAADGSGNLVVVGKSLRYQAPGLLYWTSANAVDWTLHSNDEFSDSDKLESVAFGGGVWVAVAQTGAVYNSPDGVSWVKVATLGSGGWLDVVKYDDENDVFYAAGDDGKLYSSTDGGTWDSIVVAGFTGDIWALLIHSNGAVFIAGEGGQGGLTRATFGMKAGTYTVYWVVSVPTKSGMLVTHIGSEEHMLAGTAGNSLTVTLPTVAAIQTANGSPAWMTEAFLKNKVYVDVYLKSRVGETGDATTQGDDDVLADYGAHFDFTLRPGGGPSTNDKTADVIDKLPIGRLLGDEGSALVLAFREGGVISHRERVWGIMSDVESEYLKSDEDTPVEVTQIVSGTAIGYSDIGYANLARPGNYIPIAPGDSTQFVGMVSTPSGVLAFFDNEVHLISGDANDGSLATELYPDIIGADVGTKPTKLGGIAFSIWKGNIYALAGGQAQKLSNPAYLPDDKFVEVIPEPENRSLIARTESGAIFRYVLDFQFWCNNVLGECEYMLPHPDATGTRYVLSDDSVNVISRSLDDGEPETPYITYRDIDFGDKNRVDSVYGLRMAVTGYQDGDIARLYYEISGNDDLDSDYVTGVQQEEEIWFRIPRGKKSRMCDLRIVMNDMAYGDTIEPHVKVLIVPSSKAMRAPGGGDPPVIVM